MRRQSGVLGPARAGVARRQGRLEGVGAARAAELLRLGESREPTSDEDAVPERPVLVEQQHRLPVGARASPGSRRLDLHQRHEAVHLRLRGRDTGEDSPEPQRVLAERGAHPVAAGRGGVSLVEYEVNDLEHRRQARRELVPARQLERHLRVGERLLRAHDALRDGWLRHQEGAGDLLGGEPSEQAQRERNARLRREHGVAGGEDEAKEIVADVVVRGGLDARRPQIGLVVQLPPDGLVLAVLPPALAELVERPVLRRRHQPRARVVGDPPSRATARARSRGRPAPPPRPARRPAGAAKGPRRASGTRCGRPRGSCG